MFSVFMYHTKTKIITLGIILSGVFFVFGYDKTGFLSSSLIDASVVHVETPENELVRIRLEQTNLIADKKEKIAEKQMIELGRKSLEKKIGEMESALIWVRKTIDEVNAAIVAFPAPNLEKIENEYKQKLSQENMRYEKQKIATQKLYVDTMNLIQQTYDEKAKKIWNNAELIASEDQLAATNRQNALKSLTDANIEQREKHDELVSVLEEQKQQNIAKAKTDNELLLTPLIEKKQKETEQRTNIQKELDALILEREKNSSEIKDIAEAINSIEASLAAIDYKIILLEEAVLRNIAP